MRRTAINREKLLEALKLSGFINPLPEFCGDFHKFQVGECVNLLP